MKSVSIYTLTRNQNISCVQKLERQMSGRGYFLKMREWELDSMKAFVRELETHMDEVYALWFFYSFQIPRLGKEFDLLQVREDQIVNVELKSGAVSDEALRKQLIQNRYYLAVQGKTIRSYTYISSQNRLVRLTNHDRIVDADWEQLCADLRDGGKDYEGDVEELFQAELYLISPLTEPERFLNKEYFLTAQQRDIERQILKKIRAEREMPEEGRYDGYIQLENGVGMLRLLHEEVMDALDEKTDDGKEEELSIATGRLPYPYLDTLVKEIMKVYPGRKVHIYPIRNDFFGEKITVAGLITGQDLIAQLKDKPLGDRLILPAVMFKSGEEIFLDDITKTQAEDALQIPINIVKSSGYDLVDAILDPEAAREQTAEHGAYELTMKDAGLTEDGEVIPDWDGEV